MGYNRGEKIPGYRGYIPGERPTTSADPVPIGAFFSFPDCYRPIQNKNLTRSPPSIVFPGRNHVIGHSYTEGTKLAEDAVIAMRAGHNPAGLVDLVESRPVGGKDLTMQKLQRGPREGGYFPLPVDESIGAPHLGKRKPLLDESLGLKDFRTSEVKVGTNGPGTMRAKPTASIPELPYSLKKTFTGREVKSTPDDYMGDDGQMPGYTGHLHGRQHTYGVSYGNSTRTAIHTEGDVVEGPEALLSKSGALNEFVEPKPQGTSQAELGERQRGIPGYGGHVPVKDFVLGQSYGKAVQLAPGAEDAIRAGALAEQLPGLVERRPSDHPELTMQTIKPTVRGHVIPYHAVPLPYRVSKGEVKVAFKTKGEDKKWRNVIQDDVREVSLFYCSLTVCPCELCVIQVMRATHKPPGYTGYVHGRQHVYGESAGKTTRRLRGQAFEDPTTSYELLNYKDKRPNYEDGDAPRTIG